MLIKNNKNNFNKRFYILNFRSQHPASEYDILGILNFNSFLFLNFNSNFKYSTTVNLLKDEDSDKDLSTDLVNEDSSIPSVSGDENQTDNGKTDSVDKSTEKSMNDTVVTEDSKGLNNSENLKGSSFFGGKSSDLNDLPKSDSMVDRGDRKGSKIYKKDSPGFVKEAQTPIVKNDYPEGSITSKMLSLTNLPIVSSANETLAYCEYRFMSFISINSVVYFPTRDLSHIKSPDVRAQLINSKFGHIYIIIFKKLYHYYIRISLKFILKLKPINYYYLHSINLLLCQNEDSSPSNNFMKSYNGVLALVSYGLSNGLPDILPFIKSFYDRIDILFTYDRTLDHSSAFSLKFHKDSDNIKLDYSSEFKSLPLSYNYRYVSENISFIENNSIYFERSIEFVVSELFSIEVKNLKIETVQEGTSQRNVSILRNADGKVSAMESFKSSIMINENVKFFVNDISILQMLLSLFYKSVFKDTESNNILLNEYLSYLANTLIKYFSDQIVPGTVTITNITFEVSIIRKINDQKLLQNKFVDLVNRGIIVPIAPLHYSLYLNMFNVDDWLKYAVLSSMFNVYINKDYIPFLPYMNHLDKNCFTLYANNRNRLHYNSYVTSVAFEFQKQDNLFMTFEELIVEMFVRTVMVHDIPDEYPLISRGQWIGTSGHSLIINPAKLHPVLLKYKLADYTNVVEHLIQDFSLRSKKYRVPMQFRALLRLAEHLPSFLDRFIFIDDLQKRELEQDSGDQKFDILKHFDIPKEEIEIKGSKNTKNDKNENNSTPSDKTNDSNN